MDRKRSTHSGLVHRQHASVTQKRKRSDKVHRIHERNIWQQYASGEGKKAHLRQNGPILQKTGRSDSVNGQIHHRINKCFSRRDNKKTKTPAGDHLFKADKLCNKLSKKKDIIPPADRETTISQQTRETIHLEYDCVPHDKSAKYR